MINRIQQGQFLLVASLALLVTCTNQPAQETTDDEEFDSLAFNPREEAPITREFTTATGKGWILNLVPMPDIKQARIKVETKGFEENPPPVDFGETDPPIAVHQGDLDKDGFEEIYLITQSAEPEAYGTVLGLSSRKDSTASVISFEGATPYNTKEGEPYEGYGGHDSFSIHDGVMTNVFPVYIPQDNPSNPTGGRRRVFYELVKGDGSMLLRPTKSELVK